VEVLILRAKINIRAPRANRGDGIEPFAQALDEAVEVVLIENLVLTSRTPTKP
jgi:hypothetical protein